MKINCITHDKTNNTWFMEVTTLDSGNGIESKISEATARELIKEFGLKAEPGAQYQYYYI